MSEKTYGLIAEFDSSAAVLSAAEKVRDAGYHRWDVFSPFPIHGLDKVMGLKNSRVGAFSFLFGAGAFIGTMLLIWYCNDFDYPILVGGKPMFSPPMSVVPSYILLVLASALGAFIGMVALNQLPRHHHPLFSKKRFELVSRDKFFLVIGAQDEKFSATETRQWLESIGGANVEMVEDND
jgi:Alternative complex III, ActD subunit